MPTRRAFPTLVLASGSPRRIELLRDAGYVFEIRPADIDESNYPRELSPVGVAAYLARAKAQAAAASFAGVGDGFAAPSGAPAVARASGPCESRPDMKRPPSTPDTRHGLEARATPGTPIVVLAADTIAVHDNQVIGKPADAAHARAMLASLAGTQHHVVTAVAVASAGGLAERQVTSTVVMRPLSPEQIAAYVATGAWRGKAGGYGIQDEQGKADPFVERLAGSLTNIVGLPMEATADLLAAAGVDPTGAE